MKQNKAIRKDSKVIIISGSFKPDPEDRDDLDDGGAAHFARAPRRNEGVNTRQHRVPGAKSLRPAVDKHEHGG